MCYFRGGFYFAFPLQVFLSPSFPFFIFFRLTPGVCFQANQGILRHEKKRKIEVKVAELEDLLVDQNDLSPEQIQEKVRDA